MMDIAFAATLNAFKAQSLDDDGFYRLRLLASAVEPDSRTRYEVFVLKVRSGYEVYQTICGRGRQHMFLLESEFNIHNWLVGELVSFKLYHAKTGAE